MKLKEYIKDELFKIILIIVYIILICGFLCAFNFGVQMAALMAVLAAIFFIIMFIWDFCRKRNFYNSLIDNTQRIDKKYLVLKHWTSRNSMRETLCIQRCMTLINL